MNTARIIELEAVDSTNNYALKLISSGEAGDGMVIRADYQWGGRGRSNKRWDSAAGENLTCSVILSPVYLHPGRQFLLSQALALGICAFLENSCPSAGRFSIKWPNDIYHGTSKICGILIENLIFGQTFQWAVAGIGINLNQTEFSPGIPRPTSVSLISGRSFDVNEALQNLLHAMNPYITLLKSGEYEIIENEYDSRLFMKDIVTGFRTDHGLIRGSVAGVDEYGRLTIRLEQGTVQTFMMDEISLEI